MHTQIYRIVLLSATLMALLMAVIFTTPSIQADDLLPPCVDLTAAYQGTTHDNCMPLVSSAVLVMNFDKVDHPQAILPLCTDLLAAYQGIEHLNCTPDFSSAVMVLVPAEKMPTDSLQSYFTVENARNSGK